VYQSKAMKTKKTKQIIIYSVVVPVFNEEEVISEFYKRLSATMNKLKESYEIIFVNDGSTDKSFQAINRLVIRDHRIKIIDFSRNFGQQIAMSAGIDYARGQAVINIDIDLQDPPEVIPTFIKKWKEGFEVVYGIRKERKGETILKKISSKLFYRFLKKISSIEQHIDAGDFRLIDRKAVDILKRVRETDPYWRGLTSWVGFKQAEVFYKRQKRFAGKKKTSFKRRLTDAVDGIVSFSNLPLKLATYIGFVVAMSSFIYIAYAIILKIFTNKSGQGWTSLIVVILFLGGIQLICLGILGEYVGRINNSTKRRPLYIIRNIIDLDNNKQR